ncbi:MAG: SIS domain-containing protein [Candidatus Cryptobacteroides sp.]
MNMTEKIIRHSLGEALDELNIFLADPETLPSIGRGVELLAEALESGHKVMSCGNGGSLCDATHFAEELTGRFRKSRRPLPAMSINDPAYFTCVGNDFSFGDIFSRWVEAFGQPGDVLLAISTSGTSANVLEAVEAARRAGMKVIALTSAKGTRLAGAADVAIKAPDAPNSDRIQEIHIKVIHIMIEALEQKMAL